MYIRLKKKNRIIQTLNYKIAMDAKQVEGST